MSTPCSQPPGVTPRPASHGHLQPAQPFPQAAAAGPLGFGRQVGEELRQIRPVLRVQRRVDPDQEGLLAQPALSEPLPEFADRAVAFGIRGAHPVIVVREPVTGRPHTRKYRVTRVGTQVPRFVPTRGSRRWLAAIRPPGRQSRSRSPRSAGGAPRPGAGKGTRRRGPAPTTAPPGPPPRRTPGRAGTPGGTGSPTAGVSGSAGPR